MPSKKISSSDIPKDFAKYSILFKNVFEEKRGKSTQSIYIFNPSISDYKQYANKLYPKKLPEYVYPSPKYELSPYSQKKYFKNIPQRMKPNLTNIEMEKLESLSGDRLIMIENLKCLPEDFSKISYAAFRLMPIDNKSLYMCNTVIFDKRYTGIISIYSDWEEVIEEMTYQLSLKRKMEVMRERAEKAKIKIVKTAEPWARKLSLIGLHIKEMVNH